MKLVVFEFQVVSSLGIYLLGVTAERLEQVGASSVKSRQRIDPCVQAGQQARGGTEIQAAIGLGGGTHNW